MQLESHYDSAQQLSTHCTQHVSERDKGKGLWVMLGFTVQARSTRSATAQRCRATPCAAWKWLMQSSK
ncbi:hypothetical protein AWZ03_008088 [Drosophila navojoa]|uniref:Uncharacterized protein n=1 Tax=Drosophila navojoa TaxID=7232 RepID=A0A484BCF5_DRONA|nr:hypothetical protein AWZ03_008088 [Drosophila navojoa]